MSRQIVRPCFQNVRNFAGVIKIKIRDFIIEKKIFAVKVFSHVANNIIAVYYKYLTINMKSKKCILFAAVDYTVKGFPAKVKGITKIAKKPIILNKWQKVEYIKPCENPELIGEESSPVISFDGFGF